MNVTEVLQFTDELVFCQTGKHLDDAQEAVVKGVWESKTYEEIAAQCNRSERHIRDVGYKLWQILSEKLGEDIHKSNFCWTIERLGNSFNTSNSSQQVLGLINSHINLYNTNNHQDDTKETNKNNLIKIYHDLTLAPQIINFYNRESELETLFHWILNQNTRLISVLGLSGIGKMTLVKRFVDLNLDKFEVIIWRSLKFPKSLELLIDDLLTICNQESKETIGNKLKQLFTIFTEKKSLIILDDVQNLFIPGEFAGQYQTEYQDYQNWFKMIAEVQHQSSLILISQEQCAEMHCLDEELYPIKYLELSGLNDAKILENTGLNDRDSWLNLIDLYEGNPTYLKDIVGLIKDVFNGEVAEFLAEDSLIITKKMQSQLKQLFTRLSPIEQQIVLQLSKFETPVAREELKETLNLSSMEFINGLQSLQKRYLVKKTKRENIFFELSPVFREYVSSFYDKGNNSPAPVVIS
jgi:hypothetical protein